MAKNQRILAAHCERNHMVTMIRRESSETVKDLAGMIDEFMREINNSK